MDKKEKKLPGPKTNLGEIYQSVTILYPPELIDAADKIAQGRHITRTTLMKEILAEYLEKANKDK